MSDKILDAYLQRISQLVETHMGLDYPRDRWHVLSRALKKAASALGFKDVRSFVQWLLEWPFAEKRSEVLAPFLTVGETYFFRDARLFEALEKHLLPGLLQERRANGRRLTIWSAGCASGEEPYSVAILLDRVVPDRSQWEITILGTDINESFLERANAGVYTEWSFRNVPEEIKERYFRQKGKDFEIVRHIKDRVRFSYLNLAKHPYPDHRTGTDEVDIVLCRNVLMYLTPKWQQLVVERFSRCLVKDGWLVVTSPETSCVVHDDLTLANVPGVAWFHKNGAKPLSAVPVFPAWPHPVFQPPGESAPPPEPPPWVQFVPEVPAEVPADPTAENPLEPEEPPHPPKDHLLIGFTLYEQGEYAASIEKLIAALKNDQLQDGESVAAMSLVARSYANLGVLDQALEWSERTLAADKLNSEFQFLHGTILQEKGDLEGAKRAFGKAIFLEPDFVVAHVSLSNLARIQGRTEEAKRHGRTALMILGNHHDDETLVASEGMTVRRLKDALAPLAG